MQERNLRYGLFASTMTGLQLALNIKERSSVQKEHRIENLPGVGTPRGYVLRTRSKFQVINSECRCKHAGASNIYSGH